MKKAALFTVVGISLISVILTVLIYIAPHLGWMVNSVVSGSMEPALKTGSLIVSNPVDPEEIEVGDVIIFWPPYASDNLIVHRVIEIQDGSPLKFSTQGDANLNADPFKTHEESVVGRVCVNIAGFGRFITYMKTTAGFITMVVVPAVLLLMVYAYSVWRVINQDQKKNDSAQS